MKAWDSESSSRVRSRHPLRIRVCGKVRVQGRVGLGSCSARVIVRVSVTCKVRGKGIVRVRVRTRIRVA